MSSIAAIRRFQKLLAVGFSRKSASQLPLKPIVSFTFDDFPRSALTVAGKILDNYNVCGTYYAAMGLMGKITEVGEMFDSRDLKHLVAAGHELACHTFDHVACCDLTGSELLNSCEKNRQLAAEMMGGYELRNFSFPFGVVTLSAKLALSSVYETCRTIEPGINCIRIDLAFLRANRVYSRLPIGKLKQIIHKNAQQRGWVVLYTHDVSATPSGYGCTPEYFREVLRCAIESGAEILTVAQATSRLQMCRGSSRGEKSRSQNWG